MKITKKQLKQIIKEALGDDIELSEASKAFEEYPPLIRITAAANMISDLMNKYALEDKPLLPSVIKDIKRAAAAILDAVDDERRPPEQ